MRSSSTEAPRHRKRALAVLICSLAAVVCLFPASAVARTELAVTVDDLPGSGPLPPGMTRLSIVRQMMQALREHAVPGVYGFANGGRVRDSPELEEVLRAWRKGGFLLGNHTFSHLDLDQVTADEFVADVERNEALLARWSPPRLEKYFRYPYLHQGSSSEKQSAVRRWLASRDYRVAHVTVYVEHWEWNAAYLRCVARNDRPAIARLRDKFLEVSKVRLAWARQLSAQLFKRQVKHILLLHAEPFDALVLADLLRAYRADGVTLIGLESAVRDPAYVTDVAGAGNATFLLQVAETRGAVIPPLVSGAPPELDHVCR
jgi:peptidoglycan-N-acetylglucosamine deacetylase